METLLKIIEEYRLEIAELKMLLEQEKKTCKTFYEAYKLKLKTTEENGSN